MPAWRRLRVVLCRDLHAVWPHLFTFLPLPGAGMTALPLAGTFQAGDGVGRDVPTVPRYQDSASRLSYSLS